MELEEQKPKDIFLNGREIKQEMNDFLINVKEEPIEDDHSELVIPKQNTRELLENVKEEEYSRQITSKLEEIMEPSVTNPVQNFFMMKVVPKSDVGSERVQEEMHVGPQYTKNNLCSQNLRCFVCSQFCHLKNMKCVSMKKDKLVIMIGCVLRGTYTLDQAKFFMTGRQTFYICCVHFYESINKICNVLNLENNVDSTSRSSDSMDNLMVIATALSPQIGIGRFCDIIYKFIGGSSSQKQKQIRINTKEEQNKKQPTYICSVCTQRQSSKNVKHVTIDTEKLLIMVGCLLRGDHSLEQAQLFMSQKKSVLYICHYHFSEVLNEIHTFLGIEQPDEIFSCSSDLLTKLMITVNKLWPHFQPRQFRTNLSKFFTRNMHIL